MSETREVVLLPPSPADTSGLPLLCDVQYLEPMASHSINRKFYGIVPRGIYRGFYVTPGMGRHVAIGVNSPGTAVVERDGYCITVQQQHAVVLNVGADPFDGYVVLDAIYGAGIITKQVSADSVIDAAAILLVPRAERLPHHVILCGLNIPNADILPNILLENIDSTVREQINLAGDDGHVDGGDASNPQFDDKIITIKRTTAADHATTPLASGEMALVSDSQRLAIGSGNRPGGTLQLAALVTAATNNLIVKPQSSIIFTSPCSIYLPTAAVNGEQVRCKATYSAIATGNCEVFTEDGQEIGTASGNASSVVIDVLNDVLFIKVAGKWQV